MTFNADHPARQIPRLAGDLLHHESFSLTRENFDRIAAALKES
jgi:hypothetical protein